MDRLAEPVPLRAPPNSGETLIAPPARRLGEMLAASQAMRDEWDYDVQGVALGDLARRARRQVIEAAGRYTREYAASRAEGIAFVEPDVPIFFAGHQPELFHPGVWLKNFALGRWASEHGGLGINLLIDADDVRTTDVRVPAGTVGTPRLASIPFDLPLPPQPYEERGVRDRATLCAFGKAAAECIAPMVRDPIVAEFWPVVCQRAGDVTLGQSIAQARHLLEFAWGNRTLELPQSRLCRLPAVRHLMCHLLAHLPRFHDVYNGVLNAFRSRHNIRNHAQPMPNLEVSDRWLEAPLWVWSVAEPTRRRLFVRGRGDKIELTNRRGWQTSLPLASEADCADAVERLAELEEAGIKIRTRALVTTLVARLLACDVFIHGIGGARYDEVTDELIHEFFSLTPPPYAAVSGTLHLPIETTLRRGRDAREWKQRLRHLTYHPEVFLDEAPLRSDEMRQRANSLAAEKRRWIRVPKTPSTARERHLAIQRANEQLQQYLMPLRQQALAGLEEARRVDRSLQILKSREYAFCLYPQDSLKSLLFSI